MSISSPERATMAIVAHIDDDLLFMNPDIQRSIDAGGGHTTVYTTAGDAGSTESYWLGREVGAKAAYANMAGADDWVDAIATFSDGENSFDVRYSYLESTPDIRLYFLRLPDGNYFGSGYSSTDFQSLERLWDREIDQIDSVDGANTYSADQVSGLLLGIMDHHQPETVMRHDYESIHHTSEHSGHIHTSLFVNEAQDYYATEHDTISYVAYATSNLEENLSPDDAQDTLETFSAYAQHDPHVSGSTDEDGNPVLLPNFEAWTSRQYYVEDFEPLLHSGHHDQDADLWSRHFSETTGGWNTTHHVRKLADINGDGKADIVGFGSSKVVTSYSNGESFGELNREISDFTQSNGLWRVGLHDRELADVNGDGHDDIVGFGGGSVIVSLSDGEGFNEIEFWSDDFARNDGWSVARHERDLGDFNGDGRADIVAFGEGNADVALSTGSGFEDGESWVDNLSIAQGWRNNIHDREVGDVNGDGFDDIVGFGSRDVIVHTSTGSRFASEQLWSNEFTAADGWSAETDERELADVNGDGLADIIGFGADGVHVALSNGTGFGASELWTGGFSNDEGWDQSTDERTVADVNGDGMADLIGFDAVGVHVMLSDGERFVSNEQAGFSGEAISFESYENLAETDPTSDGAYTAVDGDGSDTPDDIGSAEGLAPSLAGQDADAFDIEAVTGEDLIAILSTSIITEDQVLEEEEAVEVELDSF